MQVARLLLAALLLAAGPAPAWADSGGDDVDTEVARRLFREGSGLYMKGDYASALARFEKAREARPLPAFDFNIARCHDRLGHWAEALAEYERFTAKATNDEEAREARERLPVLRERLKSGANRAAAEEHYRRAIAYFNSDAHARAAEEFRLANQAMPDPLFLYNIAQAYRLAGDRPRAISYLEQFLATSPEGRQKKNADTWLAELRAATPATIRPATATAAPATATAAPATAASPPKTDPPAAAPADDHKAAPSERLKPVQDLIKANRPGFRECFDRWGATHAGVGGKVTLSFYLDPDGVLDRATAETAGFDAPDVATCVVAFARTLAYPPAPNGKYTRFTYPFDFKPN